MANNHNDYEELASLLYPSIEASGNVYYGQTRKLAIDELFNINNGGFESNIKTIRKQTDSNEDGFEYISYFCWKFGPLNGRIRIVPCDNDKFIFTFANFPELEKIYSLDDAYITNDSADPIVGTLFIRYKLLFKDNIINNVLNSGTFDSYEKIISVDTNDIRVYITDNCDPTNVDNRDIDDRNIFVKHESDVYYLFVKLCNCADIEKPGDALYFINMNDGESTVKLVVNGELQTDYEYYKSNIIGWEKYTAGDVITLANKNDKVYFMGSRSQQDFDNYIQFNLTGKLSAGGNINSLLSQDESVYKNITDYTTFETANGQTFYRLFFNQTSLYDVSALKLSTNKLSITCYGDMFYGCTSLINTPELPATNLANECYMSMFGGCTSLTQAPVLQATSLEHSCYMSMFENCTSLVQAPVLQAAFSADYCYRWMFDGCAKLNYIKCLMNDTSATGCTDDWLANTASVGTFECDNKKYFTLDSPNGIPVGWTITEINPDQPEPEKPDLDTFDPNVPFCIENVGDVPVEVGLHNRSSNTHVRTNCKISYDNSAWQDYNLALTTDPKDSSISKINLANKGDRVYIKADLTDTANNSNYTHLTVLNESANTKIRVRGNIASINKGTNDTYKTDYLNITNYRCFIKLFLDCVSLIQAPELPATTFVGNIYTYMFANCTSLTQAPELPATTLSGYCYDSMFYGCTSLTQAPELPATTLADGCYQYMFYGCTSLTQAPELPAATLASYCYQYMFYGCTSLAQLPELPATTLNIYCYYSMFYGCISLTQAPELPATTLVTHCYYNMFMGCSLLNYIKCLATNVSANNCTLNWLSGVSSAGDFYTPAATTWTSSNSGIPTGWTRHDI